MSRWQRTGYDYIPSPGEEYFPQGKPTDDNDEHTIIAQGTDSNLVRDKKGNLVVTDARGNRRSK